MWLNFQNRWLLMVHGMVKCNGPLSFWLADLCGSVSARYYCFYAIPRNYLG